jgi:hypothetical protein
MKWHLLPRLLLLLMPMLLEVLSESLSPCLLRSSLYRLPALAFSHPNPIPIIAPTPYQFQLRPQS